MRRTNGGVVPIVVIVWVVTAAFVAFGYVSARGGAVDGATVHSPSAGPEGAHHAADADATSGCEWAAAEHPESSLPGMTVHTGEEAEEPTADDCEAALEFIAAVRASVVDHGYENLDVALADGYREPVRSGPAAHYRLDALVVDGLVADPRAPEFLVYSRWTDKPELLGVVFQTDLHEEEVRPAGPLSPWHDHQKMRCSGMSAQGVDPSDPSCEAGAPHPEMLHVWLFDGATNPFAHSFADAAGGREGLIEMGMSESDLALMPELRAMSE